MTIGKYKGRFKPKFPKKYKGDPTNIIYRSSWEKQCMLYFDRTDSVIEWQSEELFVPYKHPIDGRVHRYYPDFLIKVSNKDKKIDTIMVEVKPFKETKEPKIQTRKTRRYINEVKTYAINTYKWKYAREYCADRRWKFIIITEKELGRRPW